MTFMTRYLFVLILLIFPMIAGAQSVRGTLPEQAGAMLTLSGYQGLETIILGEARTSAEGRFTIHYPSTYRGMGFLSTSDGESFLMVLAGEDIVLTGQSLADTESIVITQSDLLTPQFSARLERYRALRIGNPAPEIRFMAQTYRPDDVPVGIDRLSAMPSDYTVVVFAAGWCPHCREMMPELREKARTWKSYGVDVVVVSLDDTREGFQQLADGAPFLVTTDFQRWNTPSARDYHIYSVPTMFLLDRQKTIVLRPNSVTHMDSWVDWFLV